MKPALALLWLLGIQNYARTVAELGNILSNMYRPSAEAVFQPWHSPLL